MHTSVYIAYNVELIYLLSLYDLVIDITATELHNESEEEVKEDDKVDMGTCEVSESGSNLLGKTSCVVCNRLFDPYLSHAIVNSYAIVRGIHTGWENLEFPPPPKILACGHN